MSKRNKVQLLGLYMHQVHYEVQIATTGRVYWPEVPALLQDCPV